MLDEEQKIFISKAMNGDDQAFTWLVNHWYKRIYNYGYKYFLDHDLASEIAQKTFIAAHKHISNINSIDAFNSWLYTIAVNFCREEVRKSKRNRFVSIFSMAKSNNDLHTKEVKSIKSRQADPEHSFRKQELSDYMLKALNELPLEQKEVLIMKEFEGLKFREIAVALKISENTAKSRLYYGLKTMRNLLIKWEINLEEANYGY